MKIDVIFTGGTIGSAVSGDYISPSADSPRLLLASYEKNYGGGVEFSDKAPYTCLSENITAENLNALASAVAESLEGSCDGIIVTHGTDTLQYTAAFLASVFGCTDKCVCIVSSNYPLTDVRANGNANFAAAVAMIATGERGVFVPYRNGDGKVNIHLASKLMRHGEFTDDVDSLGGAYAVFENDAVIFQGKDCGMERGVGRVELSEKSPVLSVFCRPCDSFNYSLEGISAVLMLPYHSGTFNTENDGFKNFCEKCKELDIPVYAVGMPTGTTYESSATLSRLGILPLFETPFPSAYMNLWLAACRGGKIRDFMSLFCR